MRRQQAGALATAMFVVASALPVAVSTVAHAAPAGVDVPDLRLVSQQMDVENTGVFSAVVAVPDSIDAATLARATVVVTAYSRLATRAAVQAVIDGDLPRAVDSVDLLAATLPQLAPGQLQLVVPVETSTRTVPALQFAKPGLYPVVIELSADGEVLADLTTFAHRLPDRTEPNEVELSVAVAMSTSTPVTFDDDTTVEVDTSALEDVTHLADLLEASDIPIAARVPPALLQAVRDIGDEGDAVTQRLAAAMEGDDLISEPTLPLDPSAAAAAGQQALYTQWLRDGEDDLAAIVTEPSIRTVVFADQPLSTGGAALQRDLGARLMVLPASVYDRLAGTLGSFADTSKLTRVAVGGDTTVRATVVDRDVGPWLAEPSTDPQLTAIHVVASLLALRQQLVDNGENPARHGVTIGTPDLSLPDTAAFAATASLLAVTEGLDAVPIETIGVRTDEMETDGAPAVVSLPDSTDASIASRMAQRDSLQREADSTASMLPVNNARAADWARVLAALPSTALTDDQATAIAVQLRAEFAAIRDAVVPPTGFSFTLTGRRSTVPVKVLNNSALPLTVQIRTSSSKLERQDPLLVTLEPGEYTEVKLQIVARSNGEIPVTLEIYTPDGGMRLGRAVPLTASVRALSGLGNLVTGALVLVVLTWWVRHVRRNRRNAATRHAARRHPLAGNGATGDDTTPDPARPALSPDAETSTLPPS